MTGQSLLRALSTPRRREILRLLWDGERPAGEVHAQMPDVSFGAVSQHLRVLEEAGLLTCRPEGRRRLYHARKEALGALRAWLEASWDDALARLRVQAELDEARRGPRPRRPARPPRRRRTR